MMSNKHLIPRIYGKAAQTLLQYFYTHNIHNQDYIYMMHSVGDRNDFNIDVDMFKKFIEWCYGKSVRPLGFWNDICYEKNEKTICLTFDDVRESVYQRAFPILKRYKMPFTIFVATDLLDTEGYISTRQLKEMAESPLCTVGSHGKSHIAYRFNPKALKSELVESNDILKQLVGKNIDYFAFPYGSVFACSLENVVVVSESGLYKNAFSTISSPYDAGKIKNPFFIPRVNVTNKLIKELL